MKWLLFCLFIWPLLASAQDTSGVNCKIIREKDPYTRETKLSTGFIKMRNISLTIDADVREIIFLFIIEKGEKCFTTISTVDIYFEGIKSKTMTRNGGTMNCDGFFQLVFKNSRNTPTTVLQRILTRKTTQFIFTAGNGKTNIVTLNPEDQDLLFLLANCLYKEAQTLLP